MTADRVIGIIGLGQMGGAIAERLLSSGARLLVQDIDATAVARLVRLGAEAISSPGAMANEASIIFVCLPSVEASRSVANYVIGGTALRTYVEMSTVGRVAIEEIAGRLETAGIATLDVPVSGGPSAAYAGTLSLIAAGDEHALADAAPLLAAIGSKLFRVGDRPGLAQTCKLVNNALSLVGMALAAEAVVLGVKAGLDGTTMLEVINASTGRNSATADKFPRAVLTRSFDFGGPMEAATKDLGLFLAEAETLGVPAYVAAAGANLWGQAVAAGDPHRDYTRIVELLEGWAGVEVVGREPRQKGRD